MKITSRVRIHRPLALVVLCAMASALVFIPSAAIAEPIYEVTRNHDADWHFQSGVGCPSTRAATGTHHFEPGPVGLPRDDQDPEPGPPPAGNGSLDLSIGLNGDSIEYFRNTRFSGEKISDLVELTYWSYTERFNPSTSLYVPAIFVRLEIDKDGDGDRDDSLVFEPAYQDGENGPPQDSVDIGRWQHWIADDESNLGPEGNWWLGSVGAIGGAWKTLDEWVLDPRVGSSATIVNPSGEGGVILGAGCGGDVWANFSGNTDAFRIRFADEPTTTTFDMEPEVPGGPTRLDCGPEEETAPVGSSRNITCSVTNDGGVRVVDARVHAELTGANDISSAQNPDGYSPTSPDLSCQTNSDGACVLRHGSSTTSAKPGLTTYRLWIDADNNTETVEADPEEGTDSFSEPGTRPEGDEGDDTDVVQKTWVARLDCLPETATPQTGSLHTITCTARDAANAALVNVPIDVEATGVNDPDGSGTSNTPTSPDFTCTTDQTGACPVHHGAGGVGSTNTVGKTTYRAWIDLDNDNRTTESDPSEGLDHTRQPGTRAEIDNTDVVEATWSTTGSTQTPGPCYTPTPVPSGSPTPTPTGTPCPSSTTTPTPTPTPTPRPSTTTTPRPTPTPTPTEEPERDCGAGDRGISGTSGDDVLIGTSGDDVICGFGGNDKIRGKGGNDTILGGGGADSLYGGSGNDTLKGGRGRDDLHGGRGKDRLNGGDGRDSCVGGPGRNRLRRCEVFGRSR